MVSAMPSRMSPTAPGWMADERNEAGTSEVTDIARSVASAPGPGAPTVVAPSTAMAAGKPTPVLRRYATAVIPGVVGPPAYPPAPGRPPTTTPVAGVVGYYGWGNYGDELFLEVFRQRLEPAIRLRRVLDHRAGLFRHRAIGRAIRAVDLVLIGGGDIVI